MKATFKSNNGTIYDNADLALCDDAMHADFQMFTQCGEACTEVAICSYVWCPTMESVAQFGEFLAAARRFLNVHLGGTVMAGLNQFDECEGEWTHIAYPSQMNNMAVEILHNINKLEQKGKWEW